jgi:CSLREA domain-containing protein
LGGEEQHRVSPIGIGFCVIVGLALTALVLALPAAPRAAGPTIELHAPARAKVGQSIEIVLRARGVSDVAGYETQLLFDRTAADLISVDHGASGLHNRGSDLRKLGPVELADGAALGSYSCPTPGCAPGGLDSAGRGVRGDVLLVRIELRADRAGPLQLRLTDTRLVRADGSYVEASGGEQTVTVQVAGHNAKEHLAAPARPTDRSGNASARVREATGDRRLTEQDVTEAALHWIVAREDHAICGDTDVLVVDANRDGCLDVADVQTFAATVATESPATATVEATNAPFTVNSTGDAADAAPGNGVCRTGAGTCTLRAAIGEANAQAGANEIRFGIAGTGVQTIQLASALPTLSDTTGPTTINGYSQPGASLNTNQYAMNAQLKIQVRGNGSSAFDALRITSPNNVVRGIAFFNLHRSIFLYGSNAKANSIRGDFIGTNAAGTFAHTASNLSANGVSMYAGANHNQIGGTALADRNVVSGNARHGIVTYNSGSDHNAIYNNIIGLSPLGDRRLPNLKHGVDINADSSYNLIGGTGPGMRNVMSGNGVGSDFDAGVELSHGTATTGNQVVGNYIGTDLTGTRATSWTYNDNLGIRVEDGLKNTLISDNVIVNNRSGGIRIDGIGTSGNVVINNRIGVTLDGTAAPNTNYGVYIAVGATKNRIGPGNRITKNPVGIRIGDSSTDFNTITRNSIFANGGLGIDLDPTGVNPNDLGDSDTGANEQLNYPVIARATPTLVTGSACAGCTVEIFIADSDPSGYGEGRTYVGSATAGAGGAFSAAVSGVTAGQKVTATATNGAGSTSEFARNITVQAS